MEGIQEALARQQQENRDNWGLVLVIPQEVMEAARHLRHEEFKSKAEDEISAKGYTRGFEEGKEFSMKKRLKGNTEERYSR